MSVLRFVFRTLSLLRTTIMLFIRFAPNCNFVRRNHQRRTRLKRLFKLYSILIGFYNINIRPETTNAIRTPFMIYSKLRSMMNLLLKIITNVVLGLLLSLRSITTRRKLALPRIQMQRRMVGLLGADAIGVRTGSSQR
jgi:hypothetical protein